MVYGYDQNRNEQMRIIMISWCLFSIRYTPDLSAHKSCFGILLEGAQFQYSHDSYILGTDETR